MADWPYNTARWKRIRVLKLQASPLCEDCEARGITKPARAVDHRSPIKQGGEAFPPLEGLASLCVPCHSRKTARGPEAGAVKAKRQVKGCSDNGEPFDRAHQWNGGTGKLSQQVAESRMPSDLKPSLIPLKIVCGPPGAGKSAYVRDHAKPGDLIICLDTILSNLSGQPEHQAPVQFLPRAIKIRNDMLRSLAMPGNTHPAAWFIVGCPDPNERKRWAAMLGAQLILMDTQPEECARRIKHDPARVGQHRPMIDNVLRWWRQNQHLRRHQRTNSTIGRRRMNNIPDISQ